MGSYGERVRADFWGWAIGSAVSFLVKLGGVTYINPVDAITCGLASSSG